MVTLPDSAPDPKKWVLTNLGQRLLTAFILLPIVIVLVIAGGWGFTILVATLSLVGVLEFYMLASARPIQGSSLIGLPMALAVMLAFHFRDNQLWIGALIIGTVITFVLELLRHPTNIGRSLAQVGMTLAGIFYVAFPAGFMIALRAEPDGLLWMLLLLFMTWGTDTFAYIGGRLWGKHKLAPTISPKKTVEGAIVGVIGGILPPLITLLAAGRWTLEFLPLIAAAPFAAIIGDLAESGLKRVFDVKDSHVQGLDILPGHGGVLDRIDGLIWVATLTYCAIMVVGIGR